MRAMEFTIETVVIAIIMIVVLAVVLIFFNRSFQDSSEVIGQAETPAEKINAIQDMGSLFRYLGACPSDAVWKCVQPRPFDDEDCGSNPSPGFLTKKDCMYGEGFSNTYGGCNFRGSSYDDDCFCKCFPPA
ncbi:MAG: hypothetical protein ABH829_03970 [archaeon]